MSPSPKAVYNMVKAVVCLALVAPVFFGVWNKWIAGEWFCFFHFILEAPAVKILTRLLCRVGDLLDIIPQIILVAVLHIDYKWVVFL